MADCAYHHENDTCSRAALRGKDFCALHTRAAGSLAELTEARVLGAGTGDAILEQTKPAPRGARATVPAVDPEILGARMAEIMAQQEAEARFRTARKNQKRRDEEGYEEDEAPRKVAIRVTPRRVRADATSMLGLKPGFVGRWVRERDAHERPTQQRVQEFEDYGYEIVRGADGEPVRSYLGVAMQAPPEQYALRCREKSPLGALNREELMANTEAAIDEFNVAAGDEVASLHVARDHGALRRLEHLDGDGEAT